MFGLWASASGVILAATAMSLTYLRRQDRYLKEVLAILDSSKDGESAVEARIEKICQDCQERVQADGLALFAYTGADLKKIQQAGESAEITGPGVVRDLLLQAIDSGTSAEAVQGKRFLLSVPVFATEGASIIVFWENENRPDRVRRNLLEITARLLSLALPSLKLRHDLTELSHQHSELQASQEQKSTESAGEVGEEHHLASVGRLAAGVAHELNTPLGAVLTMVGSLLRKEEDKSKAKKLGIVKEAVEKCKDIITKLMVYSRSPMQTETGLTFSRFVRSDTDLNEIIGGIGEMMSEELNGKGIALILELNELPPFRANSSQWSHVFTNLIANARDVLVEQKVPSPQITVTTKTENGQLILCVADNGPGVPQAHRAKIFEPFFTTKEIGRGTGLGLAIVSEIVRKHKGELSIGDAPQGGALFKITLNPTPVAQAARPALPKEQYP